MIDISKLNKCVFDIKKINDLMDRIYFDSESQNNSYYKWLSILRDCAIYTGSVDGVAVGVIFDTNDLIKIIYPDSGEIYSGATAGAGIVVPKKLLGNVSNSNRKNSHVVVNINTDYWWKSFTVGVHRVMHLVFNGEYFLNVLSSTKYEAAYCINHKDNNGWNNRYDNLEMCGSKENRIHAEYVEMIGTFRPDLCHMFKDELVLNNGISYEDIFDFELAYSSDLDELDYLKKQGKISSKAYQNKRCELFVEYIGW